MGHMRSVKTSDLKANLAKYLRLVRRGEAIEVLDRGNPIAVIRSADKTERWASVPPLKDPKGLSKLKSEVERSPKTDSVSLLLEDRRR